MTTRATTAAVVVSTFVAPVPRTARRAVTVPVGRLVEVPVALATRVVVDELVVSARAAPVATLTRIGAADVAGSAVTVPVAVTTRTAVHEAVASPLAAPVALTTFDEPVGSVAPTGDEPRYLVPTAIYFAQYLRQKNQLQNGPNAEVRPSMNGIVGDMSAPNVPLPSPLIL